VETKIPLRAINIPPSGTHIAVSAFINGQLANVLIDTGASQTVMDRNRMHIFSTQTEFKSTGQQSKGLGTDGMDTFHFSINQFILGDLVIDNMTVTLLDLGHVNGSYEDLGLSPIDMVLGGDVLTLHKAVLNYGSMEMVLIVL
jgi:predicted aspartyl protease